MGSTNSSLSAKRIQRETGVTYKTAWRTLRQIRRLLASEDPQVVQPTTEMDNGDASGLREERSEEHTSELQSHSDLVCRLLLEKKKSPGPAGISRSGSRKNQRKNNAGNKGSTAKNA